VVSKWKASGELPPMKRSGGCPQRRRKACFVIPLSASLACLDTEVRIPFASELVDERTECCPEKRRSDIDLSASRLPQATVDEREVPIASAARARAALGSSSG